MGKRSSVASTEVDVKQRTDEERRAVVEEWKVSGETIESFCKRQGISRDSLARWRHSAWTGMEPFLPVAVAQGSTNAATSVCEVLVGEHVRIECSERTSEQNLAKAIRAAVTACGPTLVR
jgi:transposase-like protein